MGIFTSLLLPLLKTGAVIGASAIPGAGPILGPVAAGLASAGQGIALGQGPLTSLGSGALSGGMTYGMGQLGDWMKGTDEGVADTSRLGQQVSLADPNMYGGAQPGQAFSEWSQRKLMDDLMKRNSFMINKGGLGF